MRRSRCCHLARDDLRVTYMINLPRRRPQPSPSLTDTAWWSSQGAQLGRANLPATTDQSHPLEVQLAVLLETTADLLRSKTVAEIRALDCERGSARAQLSKAQASTDQRTRSNIQTLQHVVEQQDAARAGIHQQLVATLHELEQQAAACDTAWRTQAQATRDRRLILPSRPPRLPDALLTEVPDPHQP